MQRISLNLNLMIKKTCKQILPRQMEQQVPWVALVQRTALHYPEGKNGRPPFDLDSMPRVHCLRHWFSLSDPAMEEAIFGTSRFRKFAGVPSTASYSDHPKLKGNQ